LLCAVNIQHDCARFKCTTDGEKLIFQERRVTSQTCHVVNHVEDKHFILNSASLHNHQQITAVLPKGYPRLPAETTNLAHSEIRKNMAAEARDKKRQQKEAKEAKDREILLGRAVSQNSSGRQPPDIPEPPSTGLNTRSDPEVMPQTSTGFDISAPAAPSVQAVPPPHPPYQFAPHFAPAPFLMRQLPQYPSSSQSISHYNPPPQQPFPHQYQTGSVHHAMSNYPPTIPNPVSPL